MCFDSVNMAKEENVMVRLTLMLQRTDHMNIIINYNYFDLTGQTIREQ